MLRNIRFWVLLFSVLLSHGVYAWVSMFLPEGTIQTIRLTQLYALTAVGFLYLALIAGPLCYHLKKTLFSTQFLKSRRALGVSAFYFSLLHASIAFFGQLGGFAGLGYLNDTYLFSITLSFISLVILFLLAITSTDWAINKLTFPKWKILQRFVYLAGFFILIHAVVLGTHFRSLSDFIPQIFFSALGVLLFLEALRIDAVLQNKFKNLPKFGLTATLVISGIIAFYGTSLLQNDTAINLNINNQHTMDQSTTNAMMNASILKMPGMDGDKSKRYTTSFIQPDTIEPQTDTTLLFKVNDASNGNNIQHFKLLYDKASHLVMVDESLSYFAHIHPSPTADGFSVTTQFPKNGTYHLYLDFQPLGAIEQQMAFTLGVGDTSVKELSGAVPDKNVIKNVGNYQVSLSFDEPLTSEQLSTGMQRLKFTIKDANGSPVTTLKPYLAAYGHLVMINKNSYEYLHIHPTNLTPPKPDENGGPTVEFIPFGMYGPIKPGVYRLFGEFNPNGELITVDFTVEVK